MLARRGGSPLDKALQDLPSQPLVRAAHLRPWPRQRMFALQSRKAVEEDTKQLVTQDPTAEGGSGWKQGLAPLLVVSLLWGSYTPSIRYLYALDPSISPALLTALRTSLSALVLVAASVSTWASHWSTAAPGSKPSKAALQQAASLDAVSNLKRSKPLQSTQGPAKVPDSSTPVNHVSGSSSGSSGDIHERQGNSQEEQVQGNNVEPVATQASPNVQRGFRNQAGPSAHRDAATASSVQAHGNPAAAATMAAVAVAGLELGCYNFVGTALQALGLELTTSLKAAFLTQTTAVLTPCFAWLGGQAVRPHHWAACGVALLGSCLITLDGLLGSPGLTTLLHPAAGQQQQSSQEVASIHSSTTSSSSSSVNRVPVTADSSSSSSSTDGAILGSNQPQSVAVGSHEPGVRNAPQYVSHQPPAAPAVVVAAGLQDMPNLAAPSLLAEQPVRNGWGSPAEHAEAPDGSSSSSGGGSSSTGARALDNGGGVGTSVEDSNSSSSSGSAGLGLAGVHLPPDVPPAAVLVGPTVNAAGVVTMPPASEAPVLPAPATTAAAAAVADNGVHQQEGEGSGPMDPGTDSRGRQEAKSSLLAEASTAADEPEGQHQQNKLQQQQQQQQQQKQKQKQEAGVSAGSSLAGELYVLGACCCYALATVRLSVIAPHHDPVQLATAKTLVLAAASTGWWLVQGLQPLAASLASGAISSTNSSNGSSNSSSALEPLGASLGGLGALSEVANDGLMLSSSTSSSSGMDPSGGVAGVAPITTLLHAAWEQLLHPVTSGQLPAALTSGVGLGVLLYSAWGPGSLAAVLQAKGQASVQASQAQIIYSLTPVWAALLAGLLLPQEEATGPLGWCGGGVIIAATLVLSLRDDRR